MEIERSPSSTSRVLPELVLASMGTRKLFGTLRGAVTRFIRVDGAHFTSTTCFLLRDPSVGEASLRELPVHMSFEDCVLVAVELTAKDTLGTTRELFAFDVRSSNGRSEKTFVLTIV